MVLSMRQPQTKDKKQRGICHFTSNRLNFKEVTLRMNSMKQAKSGIEQGRIKNSHLGRRKLENLCSCSMFLFYLFQKGLSIASNGIASDIIKYYNIGQMTQQKHLNPLELEKATSRRSRKDEEGRDFQCGCGKRYLSYPALYTHIKTKHDGRQPEGTQKTGISMMAKKIKGRSQQELKGLTHHLNKDDIKLLSQIDDHMLGSVSIHSRFRKDHIPKEIYQHYQLLTKTPEVHLEKTSSLDLLLALYLFNLGEYINDKLYDHYLLFSKLLRSCFLEHGEEVFRACFSKPESPPFLSEFTPGEVQYVPIICDYMLRYYIPHLEAAKEAKDVNLSLMELMLSDFCSWLFKKKLTPIKVTLKKQYRLETKPVPLIRHRSHNQKGDSKDKEAKEESGSDSKKQNQNSFHSSEEMSEMEEQDNESDALLEEEEEQKMDNQKQEEEENEELKGDNKEEQELKGQKKVQKDEEKSQQKEKIEPEIAIHSEPQQKFAIPRQFHPIQTIPKTSPECINIAVVPQVQSTRSPLENPPATQQNQ